MEYGPQDEQQVTAGNTNVNRFQVSGYFAQSFEQSDYVMHDASMMRPTSWLVMAHLSTPLQSLMMFGFETSGEPVDHRKHRLRPPVQQR
eukprot:s2741_g4.t1